MGRIPEQGSPDTTPVWGAAAFVPLSDAGWGQQRGAGKEQQGSVATLLPAQEQGAKSRGPPQIWLGLTPWAPSGLLRVLLLPTQGSPANASCTGLFVTVCVPRAMGAARGQDCHCHSPVLIPLPAATGARGQGCLSLPWVIKVVCTG